MQINLFTDGGARGNPGPAATGYVIKDNLGKFLAKGGRYIGHATNNIAEYQAVIDGLNGAIEICGNQVLKDQKVGRINLYVDSQLVFNQLSGKFKIRQAHLKPLVLAIRKLEKLLPDIYYNQIPRGSNKEADFIVNRVLNERNK